MIFDVAPSRGQRNASLNVLQVCSAQFFKGFSQLEAFALLQNISPPEDNLLFCSAHANVQPAQ